MIEQKMVREGVRDFVFDHIFAAMMAATIDKRSLAEQAKDCMEIVMNVVSPRWIPVSEQLPERACYVIARCRGGQAMEYTYIDGEFRRHGERRNVTHWIPFPESPEDVD